MRSSSTMRWLKLLVTCTLARTAQVGRYVRGSHIIIVLITMPMIALRSLYLAYECVSWTPSSTIRNTVESGPVLQDMDICAFLTCGQLGKLRQQYFYQAPVAMTRVFRLNVRQPHGASTSSMIDEHCSGDYRLASMPTIILYHNLIGQDRACSASEVSDDAEGCCVIATYPVATHADVVSRIHIHPLYICQIFAIPQFMHSHSATRAADEIFSSIVVIPDAQRHGTLRSRALVLGAIALLVYAYLALFSHTYSPDETSCLCDRLSRGIANFWT